MPKLSKQQAAALTVLRAKLDPRHPSFRGAPEIAAALETIRATGYLDSWVLSLIDFLEGAGYRGQEFYVKKDAAEVAATLERYRANGEPRDRCEREQFEIAAKWESRCDDVTGYARWSKWLPVVTTDDDAMRAAFLKGDQTHRS